MFTKIFCKKHQSQQPSAKSAECGEHENAENTKNAEIAKNAQKAEKMQKMLRRQKMLKTLKMPTKSIKTVLLFPLECFL
jgi:hypothetical protein